MPKNLQPIVLTIIASAMTAAGILARLCWSNTDLIMLDTLIRPFFVITLFTLAVAGVCAFISKNLSALAPVLVLLFFNFGYLKTLTGEQAISRWIDLALLSALAAAIAYVVRNWQPLEVLKAVLVMFVAMTVPFAVPVAGLLFQADPTEVSPEFSRYAGTMNAQTVPQSDLPDVIYIVPDRYGSANTLEGVYNVDNREFYRQLRDRKFNVAENAVANYAITSHSLASTLNSGYLDGFTQTYGRNTGRTQPLFQVIADSHAQRAMRRLGYSFLNAGSWWDASRVNKHAEENFGTGISNGLTRTSTSKVEYILWQDTPLSMFAALNPLGSTRVECDRISRKLDWLGAVGNTAKPVFVYAHMTVPHPPAVMDKNGNCLPQGIDYPAGGTTWPQYKSAYGEYLRFFNRAIVDVFDRQQRRRSTAPGRGLIFVIQSDEGPYPQATLLQGNEKQFTALSGAELAHKFGIMNAMYLSGSATIATSELRTPINNWRIILEHITGRPAGRNAHQVYFHADDQRVYDYTNATSQLLK